MKRLVLALMASLIVAGCGGGGGGAATVTPAAENTTTYSTAKLLPLASTETITFNLTGSDNTGGTWTGSWSLQGEGQTVFEGQNVTKISQQVSLTLSGTATASSNVTSYYKADRSLYKAIYSGSASGYATQTNSFTAPIFYKIGDVATGPALTTYINGVTDYQTTTYQVFDGGNGNGNGNGNAKVSGTSVYTSGNSATTEQIINLNGDLVSMKMILHYPSIGRTVTLNGTR